MINKISKHNNKSSVFSRSIMIYHYEWCVKEERNIDWYKLYNKTQAVLDAEKDKNSN